MSILNILKWSAETAILHFRMDRDASLNCKSNFFSKIFHGLDFETPRDRL